MSSYVLTNAGIWLDQYDLSADFNTVAAASEVEEKDATVFGDTTRVMKGGLKTVSLSGAGFWDANGTNQPDDLLFPRVGGSVTALTIAPETTDEGKPALMIQPNISRYEFSPQVGEIKPFSFGASAKGSPLVRGNLLAQRTVGASGNGTAFQLPSLGTVQNLYGALHVVSFSGTSPTLDVKIQSASDSAFTISVADRIVFSQATGATVQWATPVSGTWAASAWWRAVWTVGGSSPGFYFIVSAGIL